MTNETETGSGPAIEVELDIFSGRPNPRWALSAEAAKRLQADLEERATAESPAALGLGYRGFVIRNLSGDSGTPPVVRVFRSVVTIPERDRQIAFRDTQGVERVLQDQARGLGYGGVIPESPQ